MLIRAEQDFDALLELQRHASEPLLLVLAELPEFRPVGIQELLDGLGLRFVQLQLLLQMIQHHGAGEHPVPPAGSRSRLRGRRWIRFRGVKERLVDENPHDNSQRQVQEEHAHKPPA
jgi:hypothetical protein